MKKKIIIIEDEVQLGKMYKLKFRSKGINVIWAQDSISGLKLINEEKPEVILLDINMPKMNGLEVLNKIKNNKKTSNIPVIVITNSAAPSDCQKAIDIGATACLHKYHFTPSTLIKKVKELIG